MASVIRWKDEQPADILDWDAGQESEQSASRDDGERWLPQVFRDEFIRLRRISDQALGLPGDNPAKLKRAAHARKVMKLLAIMSLVEVMKWPIETVCCMIDPLDHPPMGNATAERWLESARKYFALRLPKISDDIYEMVKPSRTLKRSRRSSALSEAELSALDAAARRHEQEWSDEFLADYYTATGEGQVPPRTRAARQTRPTPVGPVQRMLFAGE